MYTRTKIICTMGPATESFETISKLIDAGMNVARLNFSHGTHEEHARMIALLKKARKAKKVPLAIVVDTKGPEIRLGKIKGGQMELVAGQKILLVKEAIEGDGAKVQVMPEVVVDSIEAGAPLLFADGSIMATALERKKQGLLIEIHNAGVLKTYNGMNAPGSHIDLPAMTEQDVEDITFGCKQDVDIIAASFIRSADHVLEIKKLLVQNGKSDILVIAKIENSLGVQNFDSIVQAADGIMVARGDLGVELPLKEVPLLQKMMIRKCCHAFKPVVTATQMLESMIKNPRPTRAEVSDVANAIFDSTSAVMLSGETAIGKYPVETVEMMRSIIDVTEKEFNYRQFLEQEFKSNHNDVSSSVAHAAVKTAYAANGKAIFAFTNSGFTARLISRFRPSIPIIALTPNEKTYHQLSFNWGVIPVEPGHSHNVQEAFLTASCFALKKGLVSYGDLAIVTAGSPFGVSGTTNMMMVESIGDVIVRGQSSTGKRIHGKIAFLHSVEKQKGVNLKGQIVVLATCDESFYPLLKQALGIVLQNHHDDIASENFAFQAAKMFDIPLITRADGAFTLLKEGQLVTLDPQKGIIYKGTIPTDEEIIPLICPSITD